MPIPGPIRLSFSQGVAPYVKNDLFSPLSEAAAPSSSSSFLEQEEAPPHSPPRDGAGEEEAENEAPLSPLLVGRKVDAKKRLGLLGDKGRTRLAPSTPQGQAAITMQLYVESLHNNEVRQALENCLLKREGVLSILTDLQDEKARHLTPFHSPLLASLPPPHAHSPPAR